jgi:hypothetical protein
VFSREDARQGEPAYPSLFPVVRDWYVRRLPGIRMICASHGHMADHPE